MENLKFYEDSNLKQTLNFRGKCILFTKITLYPKILVSKLSFKYSTGFLFS